MTDKMVDVSGRRPPAWPTLAADIVGHQADVGRRHFFSSSPTLTPTSSADVGLSVGECRPPTSAKLADTHADVGGQCRRECRKTGPTMSAADTRRHSGRHSVCYPSDRTCGVVGGVLPTTNGECRAGRHAERRVMT